MKKIILSLFIFCFHIGVYGQGEIKFETLRIDLGDLKGQPVNAEYKFKNVGNEPLMINRVNCGLSTLKATYPRQQIEPGKGGTIKIEGNLNSSSSRRIYINVLTSGKIEMTRLQLIAQNSVHNLLKNEEAELEQGVSFDDWVKKNLPASYSGIDSEIIYRVKLSFEVGANGKIININYKGEYPTSIKEIIKNLLSKAPSFKSEKIGKILSKEIVINSYHYSNPNDKAYDIAIPSPDTKIVYNALKKLTYFTDYRIDFIVERDGRITNVMGEPLEDYSKNSIEKTKEAIKIAKSVGKTTAGKADGKNCRTICSVQIVLHY